MKAVQCIKSSIKIVRADENQSKQIFLNEAKRHHLNPTLPLSQLKEEITVIVNDIHAGTQSDYQWLVIESKDKHVLELSKQVCNLPWIGFAIPLTLKECS